MPRLRVCIDACFLIALYDRGDQHHEIASRHFVSLFEGELSEGNVLVAPWPILYESLGTRQVKDHRASQRLELILGRLRPQGRLHLLDDSNYRESALTHHLANRRKLSLVDRVLRAMIEETKPHFDVLLTYNTKDFQDSCAVRRMTLINEDVEDAAALL